VQIAVHPSTKHDENPVIHVVSIFFRLVLYGALFSMVGLMLFETFGRRKSGVKLLLRNGTSWRGKSKQRSKNEK
jgi:hypothetical protein